MAATNFGPIEFPQFSLASSFSNGSLLMDASGEKVAFVFQCPKDGDISKIWVRLNTVTTGDTLKISLQDVDLTNGEPDGTADQSGTVVIADGDDNTNKSVTLGTDRTVSRGDLLAIVVEFNSYVAGDLNISYFASATGISQTTTYPLLQTSGSWSKSTHVSMFSLEYSDGSFAYIPGVIPAGNVTEVNFSSSSTPDEIGLIINSPVPITVTGAYGHRRLNQNYDFVLYDSDGTTPLQTSSMDADVNSYTSNTKDSTLFSGTSALTKATNYRLVFKPTTTSNIRIFQLEVAAAAHLDQLSGGQNIHKTSRADAGSWTQDTAAILFMGTLVSAFDNGVGGGGGGLITHPGMSGGMRG